MALDLARLFTGTLVYDEPMSALDDARFERIISGFGGHYLVTPRSNVSFSFERGEGFDRFGRWDAFAYVDSGDVTRLRGAAVEIEPGVSLLPPAWNALRLTLNVRVILIFWAAALIVGWWFSGGDWLFWLIGFLALYGAQVWLIRRSVRAKLRQWLVRESWN